jgi:hypothetical protein
MEERLTFLAQLAHTTRPEEQAGCYVIVLQLSLPVHSIHGRTRRAEDP